MGSNRPLALLLLFYLLVQCQADSQSTQGHDLQELTSESTSTNKFDDKWITNLNGWERVTGKWPTKEPDSTSSATHSSPLFFYNGDYNSATSTSSPIKFKPEFIESMKSKKCLVEISFKVWMSKKDTASATPTLNLSDGTSEINLYDLYKKSFSESWMPYNLKMNSDNLDKFEISNYDNLFVAFAQFQVQYTAFENTKDPKTTSAPERIQLPAVDDQTDSCLPKSFHRDQYKTLFFPDCTTTFACEVTFKGDADVDLELWIANKDDLKNLQLNGQDIEHTLTKVPPTKKETTKDNWTSWKLPKDKLTSSLKFQFKTSSSPCNSLALRIKSTITTPPELTSLDTILSSDQTYARPTKADSTIQLKPTTTDSIDKTCIEFDYHFIGLGAGDKDLGTLEISYALEVDPTAKTALAREKVTNIRFGDFKLSTHLKICLANYVAFTAKNYTLFIQLQTKHYQNLFFQAHVKPNSEPISAPIEFLLPFGDNSTRTTPFSAISEIEAMTAERTFDELWHDQWNDQMPHFEDFFERKPNLIYFKSSAESAEVRLSTKWIYYTDQMATEKFNYRFRLTSQKSISSSLTVTPQICNQLGQCSSVLQQKDGSDVVFRLPEVKTELFRLEFIFSWTSPGDQIEVDLALLDTSHPCYGWNTTQTIIITKELCQNKGICKATRSSANFYQCECQNGYSGPKCETTDPCLVASKKNQKKTGNEQCGSLACQATEKLDGFNCICAEQSGNQIFWDSTNKKCTELKPETDLKFPLKITKPKSIIYKFPSNRFTPQGYDYCFDLSYSLALVNQTQPESFTSRPTVSIQYNSVELIQPVLTLGSAKHLKFCLQDFIPASILKQEKDFKVEFSFASEKFTEYVTTISTVDVRLSKMENPAKTEWQFNLEYNAHYDANLNYSGWRIDDLFNQDSAKQTVKLITDPKPGLHITSADSKPVLATLVSDWFISNGVLKDINIPWYDTNCAASTFSVKHFRILYTTKESDFTSIAQNQVKKSEFQAFALADSTLLKPLNDAKGALFRLVVELESSCDEFTLKPVLFRLIADPCADKCQGSKCTPNLQDAGFECSCNKGYFGKNCEIPNPCETEGKFCGSLPGPWKVGSSECIPTSNSTFSCRCWPGVFEWNAVTKSCNPAFSQEPQTICLGESGGNAYLSPIEDSTKPRSQGATLKWLDRQAYWKIINSNKLPKPFYMALNPERSNLSIVIPEIPKDKDICLSLNYQITPTDSLGLRFGSTSEILWFNELTTEQSDVSKTSICLRSLQGPSASNQTNVALQIFAQYSNTSNVVTPLVDIAIDPSSITTPKYSVPDRSYLQATSKSSLEHLFPLQLPNGRWTFKDDGSLLFKKDVTDSKRVSYLLSDWFQNNPKNLKNHTWRYEMVKKDGVAIKPIIFNSTMKQVPIASNSQDPKTNLTVITINSTNINDTVFRFGFQLTTSEKGESNVQITHLDLNDICAMKGSPCQNGGTCQIDLQKPTGYSCNCAAGYKGDNCDDVDYCALRDKKTGHTGNEICALNSEVNGRCISKTGQFVCKCLDDEMIWNKDLQRCAPLEACLKSNPCKAHQICVDSDPTNPGIHCQCIPGYKQYTPNEDCERRNPCKERKCGTNAKCLPIFDGYDPKNPDQNLEKHRMCYCAEGYVQDETASKFTCVPLSPCDSPLTNSCSQICKKRNPTKYTCDCFEGYQLDPKDKTKSICIPKKDAKLGCSPECKAPGSYCNQTSKSCQCTDKTFFEYKLINATGHGDYECVAKNLTGFKDCPGDQAIFDPKTGKITCNCTKSNIYEPDPNLGVCKLKPICDKGGAGLDDCQKQKKLCIVTGSAKVDPKAPLNITSLYKCICPPGQHRNSTGSNCISLCDDKQISDYCSKGNAFCNQKAAVSFGTETFNPSAANWSQLCECNEGFTKNVTGKTCDYTQNKQTRIYQLQLTVAKVTYADLESFKSFIAELNLDVLKQAKSVADLRKKLPPENYAQLAQELQENQQILQNLTSDLSQMELAKGRAIVDLALNRMMEQYIHIDSKNVTIRTLNCTEFSQLYINCSVEIAVSDAKQFEAALKLGKKNLADFLQNLFKENCNAISSEDTANCVILLNNTPPKLAYFSSTSSNTQPDQSENLILNKTDTIKNLAAEPFKPCKKYGLTTCPNMTECIDTGNTFTCNCPSEISKVYQNVPDKDLTKNNPYDATVNQCQVYPDDKLCQNICLDPALNANQTMNGTCTVTHSNTTKVVDIQCACANGAIEVKQSFVYKKYAQLTHKCLSITQICANYECKNNGTCSATKDGRPFCSCPSGYIGDHCQTELILIGLIAVGAVLALILLINGAWCVVRCLRKRKTRSKARHSNSIYLNRSRRGGGAAGADSLDSIEMNHYEMNGTYRRHESPKLPPPSLTVHSTDGAARSRMRSRGGGTREEEESRQSRAPASVSANRVRTSRAKETETRVVTTRKSRADSAVKPYSIVRRETSTDSSSTDSSIDLPPSRPPSPIPTVPPAIPTPSSGSASSGSSSEKPVILTRTMLLGNSSGHSTTSKTTSFQYVPSNIRSRPEGVEAAPRGSTKKTPPSAYMITNPAVEELQKATKDIEKSKSKHRHRHRKDDDDSTHSTDQSHPLYRSSKL